MATARSNRIARYLSCLGRAFTVLCWTLAVPAVGQEPCGDPSVSTSVPWSELEFRVEKWGISGEVIVTRRRAHRPDGQPMWSLASKTSLLGRVSQQDVSFRPDGQFLQASSVRRSGRSSFANQRSWEDSGVRRVRRSLKSNREATLAVESWTEDFRRVEPFPVGHESCRAVADPLEILHFLGSRFSLPEDLCFAVSGRAIRLTVEEVSATRRLRAILRDLPPGSPEGPEHTISLRLSAEDLDRFGVELLGLRDVVLTFDRREGLPLVVAGKLPHLGTIWVVLRAHRPHGCGLP